LTFSERNKRGGCSVNKLLYWCNIPLANKEKIVEVACRESICGLLRGNFIMPETVLRDEDEEEISIKANTLMASEGRIDDDRMMKVREMNGKYYIETFSVS